MIKPARHISSATLKNPYFVTRSLRALAQELNFPAPSLTELEEGLYDSASAQLAPGSIDFLRRHAEHVVDDFETQLIAYLSQFSKSSAREFITSPQDLFADFAWYLTQPLRLAEKDTLVLEGEVLDTLSRHAVMELTNTAFASDPEGALRTLNEYHGVIDSFVHQTSYLHRRVRVIEKIFTDPEKLALKMRAQLHHISNILTVQSGAVQGIMKFQGDVLMRARWIESLHASINEKLNPFNYLQKTYPQISVAAPRKYDIPHPHIVRQILQHFVQNALNAGAAHVSVSPVPASRTHSMMSIVVLDDGPGIPAALLPKLGHMVLAREHRQDGGSGLYIVRNELLPQLGTGADFTITSPPVEGGRGTLVELIFPTSKPGTPPDPAPRRGTTEGTAPVGPAQSAEGFGIPVGLSPAIEPQRASDSGPVRVYDIATAGGLGYADIQTTVALPWHLTVVKRSS